MEAATAPAPEKKGSSLKLIGWGIAAALIHRADTLMYDAKGRRSNRVHSITVRIEGGELAELPDAGARPAADESADKTA